MGIVDVGADTEDEGMVELEVDNGTVGVANGGIRDVAVEGNLFDDEKVAAVSAVFVADNEDGGDGKEGNGVAVTM